MPKRLGERLVEAGLVTSESIQKALEHQKITGHRLGDCLVEIGLLQESGLLRFLAAEFQTRFVSAEKLAKARIATEVLDKVPVRLAEAQNVLPLAIDPRCVPITDPAPYSAWVMVWRPGNRDEELAFLRTALRRVAAADAPPQWDPATCWLSPRELTYLRHTPDQENHAVPMHE